MFVGETAGTLQYCSILRSDGKTGVLGVSDAPGSLVILYLQALYNALSGLGG